uniref:HDC08474 n=1 Tax=Drosophila melanogaster TaxID=7227 RepID=Q6ILS8_DROME|nr:TPA_inf: HDC08474 [Drosophila melanogaster]
MTTIQQMQEQHQPLQQHLKGCQLGWLNFTPPQPLSIDSSLAGICLLFNWIIMVSNAQSRMRMRIRMSVAWACCAVRPRLNHSMARLFLRRGHSPNNLDCCCSFQF